MSQDNLVVNPTIDTGTDLAVKLNAWREAIHSSHMGNSRPAYAQAGITWIDEVSPSEWKWHVFDGANDLLIGTINPTNHTLSLAIGEGSAGAFTDLSYTGALTGGAGVIDIGNGQFFKDATGKIGVGTKTPSTSFDLSAKTDAMTMPSGTTAQRPATGKPGDIRFNSETGKFEGFTTAWGDIGGGGALNPQDVTPAMVSDKVNTSKGAFMLPVGTSADRPTTPFNGMIRLNSALGIEAYMSDEWTTIKATKPADYAVEYLIIAGGGGGSQGGGGAGGLLNATTTVTSKTSYTVTIGAGGAGRANGTNTSALSKTAIGGGQGGFDAGGGGSGGSGGGGGGAYGGGAGGGGTAGQGFGGSTGAADYGGGGCGGGAGAAGSGNRGGGGGGIGKVCSITTIDETYASGGGGGGFGGGGGQDPFPASPNGYSTKPYGNGAGAGGTGQSGVVIIAYQSATQKGTGGTVTNTGGFWIHTFTTSGTFVA